MASTRPRGTRSKSNFGDAPATAADVEDRRVGADTPEPRDNLGGPFLLRLAGLVIGLRVPRRAVIVKRGYARNLP